MDPIEQLENMGFRKAADQLLETGALECVFHEHAAAQNILYAFVRGSPDACLNSH